MAKKQILLTNDDGIRSPGLWAAAAALSKLGFVTVVAPREQSTGMGRSLPASSDGLIRVEQVEVDGQTWTAYAVGGSPAQAVLHAILEVMPVKPDLVVSGINYGENVGSGICISGTVGAAMESASMGIPSLAVSLETDKEHHHSYSTEVDFSTAAHFAALFAARTLEHGLPPGVDILKIDIPSNATPQTEWHWTRLSRQRYYIATRPNRTSWLERGAPGYERLPHDKEPAGTDVHAIAIAHTVSITPLTLDMTAPVSAEDLERFAKKH